MHLPFRCPGEPAVPGLACVLSGFAAKSTSSPQAYQSEPEQKRKAAALPSAVPGAKRRASRAGTRSVSTLTAAQLERKRANDREAQRAIRQRTKDHIESLERRIAELTANRDHGPRMAELLRRNEELEQENAMLRTQLSHTIAALRVAENGGMSGDNAMLAPAGAPSPSERVQVLNQQRPSSTSTARSVPSVATQHSAVSAPESWPAQGTYGTTTSSQIDGPPQVGSEVPHPPPNIRWSPHHPVNAQVQVPEPNLHSVESNVPQPINYVYVVDPNGRPVQYQAEGPSMGYPPVSNPPHPPPPSDYQQRQIPAQMTPAPSYAPYSSHQSYMPPSSHSGDHPVPMMQRGQLENQHMMYHMHGNVKHE
ncbi:hypothetical protein BDY21DRAFT_423522 [Lineolata rhizophorae]|uniref:BZIP domain-containing protein n=1 Tax=Lineolata rhizophorae TaxID=578093 RepID=A0A6A6NT28_9PEZI|nr:hypothetical protein BDY21DRAFT_423522 [Lineolata rhizophorae]